MVKKYLWLSVWSSNPNIGQTYLTKPFSFHNPKYKLRNKHDISEIQFEKPVNSLLC